MLVNLIVLWKSIRAAFWARWRLKTVVKRGIFLLHFLVIILIRLWGFGRPASQRWRWRDSFFDDYFPDVSLTKLLFTSDSFFSLLLNETGYWNCKGWRNNKVAYGILLKVLGLGNFIHLLVEQLVGISGEDSFNSYLFYTGLLSRPHLLLYCERWLLFHAVRYDPVYCQQSLRAVYGFG